ncbi:MAG: element excision factor XisH family protein [Saprospiraceae bacterium]
MAKDLIHNAVREALENDGWTVVRDPFTVDLTGDDTYFDIDLAAEKKMSDGGVVRIAAIEIKSFTGLSILYAFHEALGQFLNYRAALDEEGFNMELYLAVSVEGWERISELSFIQRRIRQFQLKFILADIHTKTIVEWIS